MSDFSFVIRLEKLLRNKALTISDFAYFMEESPETVYKEWIGKGTIPSEETLQKMCSVFDINLDRFLEPDLLDGLTRTMFAEFRAKNRGRR
jgi:transcriptional regulator with XRE-family HTH domain